MFLHNSFSLATVTVLVTLFDLWLDLTSFIYTYAQIHISTYVHIYRNICMHVACNYFLYIFLPSTIRKPALCRHTITTSSCIRLGSNWQQIQECEQSGSSNMCKGVRVNNSLCLPLMPFTYADFTFPRSAYG